MSELKHHRAHKRLAVEYQQELAAEKPKKQKPREEKPKNEAKAKNEKGYGFQLQCDICNGSCWVVHQHTDFPDLFQVHSFCAGSKYRMILKVASPEEAAAYKEAFVYKHD